MVKILCLSSSVSLSCIMREYMTPKTILLLVKPITVNIYFKQANPAVGSYNPEKMQRNIPACVNVF